MSWVINQKAGWVPYSTLNLRCVQWTLFSPVFECWWWQRFGEKSLLETKFSGIFRLPYWDMSRELDVDVELFISLVSKTEIWNFTTSVSVTKIISSALWQTCVPKKGPPCDGQYLGFACCETTFPRAMFRGNENGKYFLSWSCVCFVFGHLRMSEWQE